MVDSVLTQALQSRSRANSTIITKRWFYGKHTNMVKDYDAHPTGMLNNMLAQFINQLLGAPFPPILDNLLLQDDNFELSTLCDLFVSLTEALPTGTVLFCVIDGISYYEDNPRRSECIEVLSMLTALTRRNPDPTDGCLVKLLVTAPIRSHCVQDLFTPAEVFDMEEKLPPKGGFSALEWDLAVGRVIDG